MSRISLTTSSGYCNDTLSSDSLCFLQRKSYCSLGFTLMLDLERSHAIPLVPSCHLLQKSQLIWVLRRLVWQLSSSGLCFFSPGICSSGEIYLWRLTWLGSNGQSYWGRVAHSWAVRTFWWLLSFSQP